MDKLRDKYRVDGFTAIDGYTDIGVVESHVSTEKVARR